MNTMKKWVVAGLIGLSSAAVSMATTYLDLNAYPDDTWGTASATASYPPSSGQVTTPSTGNGIASDRQLLADNLYNNGATRTGSGTINGSEMTFTYSRNANAGTVRGSMTVEATYWMPNSGNSGEFTGLNMGDYQGLVIDFQDAASSYLANNAQVNLYLRLSVGGGDTYEINLDSHGAGTIGNSFAWADFGTFDPLLINSITLGYGVYVLGATTKELTGVSFSEHIVSFNLYGPDQQGVPEPETVWMMLAVLASLGVTFRRQLMDLAGRFVKT